jgi:hypothetical protein
MIHQLNRFSLSWGNRRSLGDDNYRGAGGCSDVRASAVRHAGVELAAALYNTNP